MRATYKPEFLTALDLRAYVPGEWIVLALLIYQAASGLRYYVPARFITDLASIPLIARPFLDRNGKSRRAAVMHDYLYCSQAITREEADDLFLEALLAEGISRPVAYAMWAAVRAWGWRYWNKRTKGAMLPGTDDFYSGAL